LWELGPVLLLLLRLLLFVLLILRKVADRPGEILRLPLCDFVNPPAVFFGELGGIVAGGQGGVFFFERGLFLEYFAGVAGVLCAAFNEGLLLLGGDFKRVDYIIFQVADVFSVKIKLVLAERGAAFDISEREVGQGTEHALGVAFLKSLVFGKLMEHYLGGIVRVGGQGVGSIGPADNYLCDLVSVDIDDFLVDIAEGAV